MAQVSVIIPTYNADDTIAVAVDSALGQRRVDVEVIIVDDGSEDHTCKLLRQFQGRVTLIRRAHQGRSAARNAALAVATAPLVAFLDADDVWLDTKLQVQVSYLERYPEAALTYSCATLMNAEGVCLVPPVRIGGGRPGLSDVREELLDGNMLPLLTVTARTEVVKKAGIFAPALDCFEDWDLWLRVAALGSFHFSEDCLANYRMHGIARLAAMESRPEAVKQCVSMLTKYGNGARVKKAVMHVYARGAVYSCMLENYLQAVKYLRALATVNSVTVHHMLCEEIDDLIRFMPADAVAELRRGVKDALVRAFGE